MSVNVVDVPAAGIRKFMSGESAAYVWAGVTGPCYGLWDAFDVRPNISTEFSSADWATVTEAARQYADGARLETLYVVHNA